MAKQTIQVADKPTLDTIKAEIEELKATLASVSEIVSGLGSVEKETVFTENVFVGTNTSDGSFEINGKGTILISDTSNAIANGTYAEIIIDDVTLKKGASYKDLYKYTEHSHFYKFNFNKSFKLVWTKSGSSSSSNFYYSAMYEKE